jgi:hypothetical protein
MDAKAEEADFEVAKYGYDRHHEVALNQYTHALEVEQLKLLILLNGGAATALLTFAEDVAVQTSKPWFLAAILCWLVGLAVGAGATIGLRYAQSQYARFYRLRRQATEWRRLRDNFSDNALRLSIGFPTSELLARVRKHERRIRRKAPGSEIPADMRQLDEVYREIDDAIAGADPPSLFDAAANAVVAGAHRINDSIFWLSLLSVGFFVAGAIAVTAMVISADDSQAQKGWTVSVSTSAS